MDAKDTSGIEENSFKFLDLNFSTSLDNHCKNNAEVQNENEHKRSVKNPNNYSNDHITKILEVHKLRFLDQGKLLVCMECEIILASGSFDYHFRTFHGVNLNTNERSTLLLALNQKNQSLYAEPFAYTELQEHLTTNLHLLDYIPGLSLIQGYRCTKCNLGESTVGLLHQSHRYFNILKCSEYKNFIKDKIQLICSDFKKFGHGIKSIKRSQFIDCSETKNSTFQSNFLAANSCCTSKKNSKKIINEGCEVLNPMPGRILTAEENFRDITSEINIISPQKLFDFNYNLFVPFQKLPFPSTPFLAPFIEKKSDSIGQIDTSALVANSNRKKVEDIVSKYIHDKKQCKNIVDKLESIPITDTITLNDLIHVLATKHRPNSKIRIQMMKELEATNLFKINYIQRRSIIIVRDINYFKEQ